MHVILAGLRQSLGPERYRLVLVKAGVPEVFADVSQQGRNWPQANHQMVGSITRAVFDLYPADAGFLLFGSGRAQFELARKNLPIQVYLLPPLLKALPLDLRMKTVLEQAARDNRQLTNSDPRVVREGNVFYLIDTASPTCAGQTTSYPMCLSRAGLITAAMEWLTGRADVKASEETCRAMGAQECRFRVPIPR